MTIPETLRQASEALQQASAALVATAQAMEDAPGPEPAPEPAPGEWRNDREPTSGEQSGDTVWAWYGRPMGAMRRTICTMYAAGERPYWAPGNRPAPKSPPGVDPKPEPAPAEPPLPARRWIVDRLPTVEDGDDEGDVAIFARPGAPCTYLYGPWYYIYPGTPWAPIAAIPKEPFDPTALDRNGWIRSRLPTVEDTGNTSHVLIPVGHGGTNASINYHLIVPGQPWAPWGSNPGGFEK